MANVNFPQGLTPVNMPYGNVRCRLYNVTDAGTALYIGDPVALDGSGLIIRTTEGAGNYLCGAVIGLYDSSKAPLATLTDATVGYALVADDPNQQFLIQEDAEGTALTTADVAMNADLLYAAANTFRNRSGFQLDASSVTTSTNAQLRILALQDIEGNTVGDYAKWIVKINYHQQLTEEGGDSI